MMHLIGELITEFRLSIQDSHEILASKNQNMRDVVTELDLKLHRIGKDFTQGSGYSFVSEESFDESQPLDLVGEKLFIFDPVDGSNNLLLGIDSICSVGAFVNHGQIESSFLVAFGEAQYRTWDGSSHVTSRRVGDMSVPPSAPYYFAYAPTAMKSPTEKQMVTELFWVANSISSGVYRDGSAGAGIARCLNNQLKGIIAVNVRVWDVLAGLPMLASSGFYVGYRFDGARMSLMATPDSQDFEALSSKYLELGFPLHEFSIGSRLEV